MLLDTIELVAEALDGSGTISLVCPTGADRTALQRIVPSAMQILADGQGSLMAGLDYGLTYHISQGYHQVVLLDGVQPARAPVAPESWMGNRVAGFSEKVWHRRRALRKRRPVTSLLLQSIIAEPAAQQITTYVAFWNGVRLEAYVVRGAMLSG